MFVFYTQRKVIKASAHDATMRTKILTILYGKNTYIVIIFNFREEREQWGREIVPCCLAHDRMREHPMLDVLLKIIKQGCAIPL